MPFKFMKAVDFTGESISKPVAAEVKIDGVNGGFLNDSGFTSRTGRPFANKAVTQFFSHPLLRGFNGELALGSLVDGKTCRRTTSLVNSFSCNTNGELPTLYPFDYITEQTWRFKYVDRFKLLRDLIDKLPPELTEHIKPLPAVKLCKTIEEVWDFHAMVVKLGYEGTVLRDANGQHKNGRSTEREGGFMRIKDQATSEALVLELIEAEENLNPALLDPMGYTIRSSHKANKFGKGMLGSFKCLWEGKMLFVSAGELTHDERREIWETQAWKGKTITFRYMTYGMKDLPRFPRFVAERRDNQ